MQATADYPAALRALLECGHDAIIELDGAGRVLAWSGPAERLLGWSAADALGQRLGVLCMAAALRSSHEDQLQLYLESGDANLLGQRAEWTLHTRNRTELAVEATLVPLTRDGGGRFMAILHDIGERRMLLASLDMMALRDPLTRLPNRRALMQALPEAMQRAHRVRRPLAVLAINVHGLKQVNASHGYDAGDAVLAEFGARIVAGLRRTDTVARLAGDEFIAVLEMVGNTGHASDSAAKLRQALLLPYPPGGPAATSTATAAAPGLTVGASIGVVLYDPSLEQSGAIDAAALLLQARVAPACRVG